MSRILIVSVSSFICTATKSSFIRTDPGVESDFSSKSDLHVFLHSKNDQKLIMSEDTNKLHTRERS